MFSSSAPTFGEFVGLIAAICVFCALIGCGGGFMLARLLT